MATKISIVLCISLSVMTVQVSNAASTNADTCVTTGTFSSQQYIGTAITLKILLVEFTDVTHRTSPSAYTKSDFENLLVSSGVYVTPNMSSPDGDAVYGSLGDYFQKMSSGNLTITGYVVNTVSGNTPNWIALAHTKAYYHSFDYWNTPIFSDAVNAANAAGLDVSVQGNTRLVIIYAGNTYFSKKGLNPMQTGSMYISSEVQDRPYEVETSSNKFTRIGLHCHEFAHTLGIIHSSGSRADVMEAGTRNGPDNRGAAPAPLNPIARAIKGWLTPTVITGQQQFDAYYLMTAPQVFRINSNSGGGYFLLENRRFNQTMVIGSTTVPDFNNAAFFPPVWSHGSVSEGMFVWRVLNSTPADYPDNGLIYASGSIGATCPEGTPSETDDAVPFPGNCNVKVLSPWSDSRNASPNLPPASGIFVPDTKPSTNVGMEILSENPTAGYFTIMVYQTNPQNASPSKPRGLAATKNADGSANLTWTTNSEPDMSTGAGYNVYRAISYAGGPSPVYSKINGSLAATASYTDNYWSNMAVPIGTDVTILYRVTAVDNTSKESVQSEVGSLFYTYQEFILDAAYQNKSMSANAMTANGQRKLLRESTGKLHLVFESGNQIFYRNSSNAGTTWQAPIKISDGVSTNTYPCITERSNYIYATWQKANGVNWDIMYDYSTNGGTSWLASQSTITSSIICSSPGPLPVILASPPGSTFELVVAYRTSTALNSRSSTNYPLGGSWASAVTVSGTTSTSQNPSLTAVSSYGYFKLVWDDNAKIYHENLYPGTPDSWSGLTFVNSGTYGIITNEANPTMANTAPNADKQIAWQGTQNNRGVILTCKNLATVYTEFINSNSGISYWKPSVSGHISGRATLVWHDNQNTVWKSVYDGASWILTVTMGTSGINATTSVMNPQGGDAKAIWTNPTSSPYPIVLYGTTLNKVVAGVTRNDINSSETEATLDDIHRRIMFRDPVKDRMFSIEIGRVSVTSNQKMIRTVDFVPVIDTSFLSPSRALSTLESEALTISDETVRISFPRIIDTKNMATLFDQRNIGFEVVNVSTGDVVATFGFTSISERNSAFSLVDTITIPGNLKTSSEVKIRLKADDVASVLNDLHATVINVYFLSNPSTQAKRNGTIDHVATRVDAFKLEQNYPNPFNPATSFKYQIATAGQVSLKIYDVLGREVASIVDERKEPGEYNATWDASGFSSGVYFFKLQAVSFTEVKKMLLVH